ncbi:MAG: haloacid dehalogenase-like hydrolase [Clostridia bacterium]|nr:haloacid dehalogenase-like hydrolase [Clostridia bacterium]
MNVNNNPINIFDFDGTLTTETWPKFWVWVKKFGYDGTKRNACLEEALTEYRKKNSGSMLETFFTFFNDLLVNNNETITFEELMEGEKFIHYNSGVIEFVRNTNSKNYIISGGLKEFLQNLEIAKHFDGIYGTPVIKNNEGKISGIGTVMTDENKILAIHDILKINNKKKEDCRDVYYIGDGYSDKSAMEYIHNNGGKAIFVYPQNKEDELYQHNNQVYKELNENGIIDFACVSDYRNKSSLYNILERRI